MNNAAPRIICLNQTTTHSFGQLLEHLGAKVGPVLLFTGSDVPKLQNVEVRKAPAYDNHSSATRALTWGLYVLRVGGACLLLRGRPVLFVTTNPPLLPWLAWCLAKIKGWAYVVLVWDVYPDALVRFGYSQESGWVTKMWRYLNGLSFKQSLAVITIGERMGQTLCRNGKERDNAKYKLQIIPSWVNHRYIRPISKERNWFAQKYGQVGKLTVLYSGNMGLTHDLTTLIEVAERWRSETRVGFLLIGEGQQRAQLEEIAVRKSLTNVTFLPLQSNEDLPYSLATGDVAIVSLGKGAEGISMPSKSYSMMGAGCALLGVSSEDSDLAQTIKTYECGINVESGDAEALDAALRRFLNDPEYLALCRANARRAAETTFSFDQCAAHFEQVFKAA